MDTADRLDFAPPPTAGLLRALTLAVLAHAVLVTALTWGVRWKRDAVLVTAEAELWSQLPQAAAPRPVQATPTPAPAPPTPAVAQPETVTNAAIVLEREKQHIRAEREQAALQAEQQRRAQKKAALENKREQEQQAVLEKKKAKQSAKAADAPTTKQETAQKEAEIQSIIQRSVALAAGTGAPSATGSATQSAAPSAGYAARVVASIKPNVTFTEVTVGNPMVEIVLRSEPDGAIIVNSIKVTKGSGNERFDAAVVRGIEKTRVLPRDVDGRVPSPMVISYSYR